MAKEGQRVILVAVDGSEVSENAFNWCLENMYREGDFVRVISVVEYTYSGMTVGPLADYEAIGKQFRDQQKAYEEKIDKFLHVMSTKKVKGIAELVSGNQMKTWEVICEEAAKASQIVIGTRALSKFKKAVLGSVSQHVLNHAPCPVTVVPNKH